MSSPEVAYEKVKALVNKFKGLSSLDRKRYNEAATRQGFILPLFGPEALGWNIEDTSEVSPDVSSILLPKIAS